MMIYYHASMLILKIDVEVVQYLKNNQWHQHVKRMQENWTCVVAGYLPSMMFKDLGLNLRITKERQNIGV